VIFKETVLESADNSGVKKCLCIKVLGHRGIPGRLLIVTLKKIVKRKFRSKKKYLRKGEIHKALPVCTSKGFYRKSGFKISASSNSVVILRKEHGSLVPYATRIKKGIFREIRTSTSRVLSMAPYIY
jgi:large subunit ribosomal protein L14